MKIQNPPGSSLEFFLSRYTCIFQVYFAKEVDTGDEYAIKVLLKSAIRRENKVQYVLREKDIMAALTYGFGGHPFVVKLYCTFQDPERLCEQLAFLPGTNPFLIQISL